MIRGTTPKLEFTLPFGTEMMAEAFVTFSQNNTVIFTKKLESCTCSGNVLTVQLTQQDTLSLKCDCTTEIQVRVRTTAGDALASEIIKVSTGRILQDGEI